MQTVDLDVLYGENADIEKKRYERISETMIEKFGHSLYEFYSCPGRSEIIGNHTDHNGGKVIAASINMDTIAAAAKNDQSYIRIISEGHKGRICVDTQRVINTLDNFDDLSNTERLVAGVCRAVINMGYNIGGFDAYVTSEVVPSAGVSSSASFEMLIGGIINDLFNNGSMTIKECARAGQYAENVFWNKSSGLMDQIACAVGGAVYMDFKTEGDVTFESFDLPFRSNGYTMILTNTGKGHADLSAEYSAIPSEMYSVAQSLGSRRLCDTTKQEFLNKITEIKGNDRALLRALHFYNENERVECVRKSNDIGQILSMIEKSGHSSWELLQNCWCEGDYKEQGITLALALSNEFIGHDGGVCRVHGGGFAGVILAVIKDSLVSSYVDKISAVFDRSNVRKIDIRPYGLVKVKDM